MRKLSEKNSKFLILIAILCAFSLLMVATGEKSYAASSRGIKVSVKDTSGNEIPMYEGSYALLIGVSDYTAGWPDLRNISSELDRVEKTLRRQGFQITRIMNPDSKALTTAFEEFIDQHGFDVNNRLLFFFSGHGHTRNGGEKGYLVPSDAPHPIKDERGFLQKALPMAQILSWSRQMESKHALFLFDSCFSGTVFKIKALPGRPPHITRSTSLPVRQYITAGDAGDAVPASSVFTPVFVDALEYGWADLNGDGYISGTELGIYLQEKVPQHTAQTPQYGKIRDYKLSRGDYVFLIQSESGKCTLKVDSTPPGAKILVDGRLKGTTPLELTRLKPGRLTVDVQKEGYSLWKEQVLIREDRPLEIKAVLKEIVSGGIIQISSDVSQASWYLDGVYAGRTPDEMKNVSPGSHRITVKGKGYSDWTELVNVSNGERLTINAQLRSPTETASTQSGRLYVDPQPSDATVKIMNISPKYSRGMPLSPGSYHINVSAPGFLERDQWIQLSNGEEKYVSIHLPSSPEISAKQTAKPATPVNHSSRKKKITGRDGVYVAYADGIVKNTHTGLEWKAGLDKDTTWDEARSWVQNLNVDGGGWRMPTKDEIKSLYKARAGSCNMTPLFNTTAWWVWSADTKDSSNAWIFYFSGGYGYWLDRKTSSNLRAFAVRSGTIENVGTKDTAGEYQREDHPKSVQPPVKTPNKKSRPNNGYRREPEIDVGA
ncbi:MAG: PEGA domain-containing protein [Deltaproteobacteria bacterium]|nr:PEGA domain-containing protein [Deltaproteobacteria bacterium]